MFRDTDWRGLGRVFRAALAAAFASHIGLTAGASPDLDPTASNAQMEAALQGPGIAITPGSLSATAGQPRQYGTFTDGDLPAGPGPVVGIDRGIFLATADSLGTGASGVLEGYGFTGTLNAVKGPNDAPGISSVVGTSTVDPQLTGIAANAIFDPVILELEATPSGAFIKFSFAFGSDEYPEYVCTVFNDAFGFFIREKGTTAWTNAAVIPGKTAPIAVNTINNGGCGSQYVASRDSGVTSDLSNAAAYVNNGQGTTPASNANLQYDGFTIPFVVDTPVTPGTTYEIKLAIADAGDAWFDSAVFLKWISSSDFLADADVELALSVDDTAPTAGSDTVTFTLTVANSGQDPVSGVQADFDLPAGFTWVSDTSGGNYNAATGIWSVPGSLAATGGSQSIDIVAIAGGPAGATDAWAQVTTMNANDVDSLPGNGTPPSVAEDDEALVTLNVIALDRSDAPTSGTSYGEATHIIMAGDALGTAIDADAGSISNADASGDGADDDGVTFPALTQGASVTIPVSVTQASANRGYLQGWIDWNGDGDFADAGEQIATDLQSAAAGTSTISVPATVPADATSSPTFARFRWSTSSGLDTTAAAPDGEVEDYQLTVQAGSITVSGRVFEDNGAGGAGAHDGLFAGGEGGLGGVLIQALDVAGDPIAEAVTTDGEGLYTLILPHMAAGTPVTLAMATPGGGWRYISGMPGDLPAPDDRLASNGEVAFTPATGGVYTGVDVGQVRDPVLVEPRQAALTQGQVVLLAHEITLATAGTLTLALANETQEPAGAFALSLILDANCNGAIDAGEGAPPAGQAVAAGDTACVLVRVQADAAAPAAARLTYDVLADFAFAGTAQAAALTNTDRVTVSQSGALILTKQVCNATASACDALAGTGFAASNAGRPGDRLLYRIVFEASGPEPVDDVEVFDDTPAWSSLSATAPTILRTPSGLSCTLATPPAPGPGYTGALGWTCTGTMVPGEAGIVTFEVRVDE